MVSLKKIISSLHDSDYRAVELSLEKTGGDNFLYLLRSYRSNSASNEEIISNLGINNNSFYVLKSRLSDKIQEILAGDIFSSKEEVVKLLHQIPDMCYNNSREVTSVFLEKLEKDLLHFDMHNELTVVYSAFKKINLYTQNYFHYSQLYNKHIAFSLSLEKSEEILGNFNRVFGLYNLSRLPEHLATLQFLRKEIANHFKLNPSRQVEIIKGFIELTLVIFCDTNLSMEFSTDEKLHHTQKLVNELPPSLASGSFRLSIDFYFFEYYYQLGQLKNANAYYEKVNAGLHSLLLYTNTCPTAIFLGSRIRFLAENNRLEELITDDKKNLLFDSADFHSTVLLGIYHSMLTYYSGNVKQAALKLNDLLNQHSFKDFFHINTEIKLALIFFYLELGEFDLADNLIKNIYRKIKTEKLDNYNNILDLLKVFGEDVKGPNTKVNAKQKDSFALFTLRNSGSVRIVDFLMFELKKKYN